MMLQRGLVVARVDRSAFVRRQIRTIVTPFLLCNGTECGASRRQVIPRLRGSAGGACGHTASPHCFLLACVVMNQ
jgi:tRNA U38,U39,U40 pseudouridine synthase TruA